MKRSLVFLAVAIIAAFAACSNQGEGEVCNIENDNADCKTDEGLVCYPFNQLNNVSSDRCCPADRSRATHPACVTAIAVGGITDAQAPADTGPAPSETPDGGAETDAQ
ncbi:MAG: hypothetical protein KIT84_35580 [Labilithrix sp.]|nr:hypothetical protein [Labilithrix sp.]MCW5816374.1 hypothetical protein [Labilithrix sp.]